MSGEHVLVSTTTPVTAYAKAIVALLVAALVSLAAATTDGAVTGVELINAGIAVVTALGVTQLPNADAGLARWTKLVAAVLGAALMALVLVLADGVTTSEWITVVLAALGAAGVGIVPNTDPVPREADGDGIYSLTEVGPQRRET